MANGWPQRPMAVSAELTDSVARAWDRSDRGVALTGPAGAGKTTLAEQVASRTGADRVLWVIGTPSQAAVPFGAFESLAEIAEAGKPAALIRAALEAVRAEADGALVIVDDAHLLDPLSATLVYQLAQTGTKLLVTADPTAAVPAPVAALWLDGLLEQVDVPPAAPVPPETVDRFLAALPAGAAGVLAYLAAHEPLSRADLEALAGAAAVEAAEAAGALRFVGARGYAGHPQFVARAAAATDDAAARRLRSEVAAQLATHPQRHMGDRLRRAVLTLDCDAPDDVDEVVAAAQQALRLGDLGLSERLARAALERADRLDARLALGYALAWQGRGREADAVLAAVDAAALSEEEVMAWALPRAANQFWMLSEPERATAFLHNTRRRISTPGSRLTLDALSATFAMNAGNVGRAVEIASQVLASPDAGDMAVAWAASAAALCSARMGRFADVGPLVERAQRAEHPGLLRFTVGLAETTTLLMSGADEAALQTARRFTDFAELAQPGRAIGEVLLAGVLLAGDDPAGAARLLAPAATTLERTGYSWGPLSLMYLVTALGRQGQIAESAKALGRAESRHGTKSALFAPELGVARAWRLATIGDKHGAISAAREAARTAERSGQLAVAVRAWHEAARLGDVRARDGLAKLSGAVDCAFTRMAVDHAGALTAG